MPINKQLYEEMQVKRDSEQQAAERDRGGRSFAVGSFVVSGCGRCLGLVSYGFALRYTTDPGTGGGLQVGRVRGHVRRRVVHSASSLPEGRAAGRLVARVVSARHELAWRFRRRPRISSVPSDWRCQMVRYFPNRCMAAPDGPRPVAMYSPMVNPRSPDAATERIRQGRQVERRSAALGRVELSDRLGSDDEASITKDRAVTRDCVRERIWRPHPVGEVRKQAVDAARIREVNFGSPLWTCPDIRCSGGGELVGRQSFTSMPDGPLTSAYATMRHG